MNALKRISNVIHAIEEWEEDFDEEVSEDINELLSIPITEDLNKIPLPTHMDKIDRLDKLLLLLDPKFRNYLEDEPYKLPIDGTNKEEK